MSFPSSAMGKKIMQKSSGIKERLLASIQSNPQVINVIFISNELNFSHVLWSLVCSQFVSIMKKTDDIFQSKTTQRYFCFLFNCFDHCVKTVEPEKLVQSICDQLFVLPFSPTLLKNVLRSMVVFCFPGSSCNRFSTRSYQLPVMDSIFVRKYQRGKGFGLQMLEDFVLSFKEDNLGLRYPLTKAMYKGIAGSQSCCLTVSSVYAGMSQNQYTSTTAH